MILQAVSFTSCFILLTGNDVYVHSRSALFEMDMMWYYVLDLASLIFLEYDEI